MKLRHKPTSILADAQLSGDEQALIDTVKGTAHLSDLDSGAELECPDAVFHFTMHKDGEQEMKIDFPKGDKHGKWAGFSPEDWQVESASRGEIALLWELGYDQLASAFETILGS
jgi:hypothetical protein